VLVHCAAGVSRSATLCIAYVMWKERLRVAEAFLAVQSKRTIIDPNEGFREQLVAWDSHLFEGAPWPHDGVSEEELDARVDPAGPASGMFCLAGCCGRGDSSKAPTPAAEDGMVVDGAGAMPSPLSAEAASGSAAAVPDGSQAAAGAGRRQASHLAIKAPMPPPCDAGASRTPVSASSRAGTPPVRGDVDKAVLGAAAWIIEGRTPTPTSALLGLGLGPLTLSAAGGGASGASTPTSSEVERACGLAASPAADASGSTASGLAASPAADASGSTTSSGGGGS